MAQGLENIEPLNLETTAGVIAAQIRARIMDGSFPPGSPVGEAQLAGRLNVSRGPVREGLQRLVQEGLLVGKKNRGVFVISLDEDDVRDVYLARRVIERESATILVRSGDATAIARLEETVDRMSAAAERRDWPEITSCDLAFHETLVRSTRSKRLQRMFGTLLVEARICLSALESAYPVHERLVREHENILDAIREGNERRALELIDAHLWNAVEDLTGHRGGR